MINIRYHIVSITAVFLALGIGVALGSTFLDRATVDVLDANIRSAETRIDAANKTNSRLDRELDQAKERDTNLIVIATEDLVSDHLSDVPVLIVTAPGVDDGEVDAMRTVLERTGADLRGTLALNDKLRFDGDLDEGLADDLEVDAASQQDLGDEALTDLRAALETAGAPAEDQADPEAKQPEIVTTLLDHGYLDLEPGPGLDDNDPILEVPGYRYVVVGAPGLELEDDQVVFDLLGDEGVRLPAVVVSSTIPPSDGDEQVESTVTRLRDDEALADRYSTVDDVDTLAGLVSTVYVLQQFDDLAPDHYGQADGASAVLAPVP